MRKFRINLARLCWVVVAVLSIWFYGRFGKEAYNFYGDALGYYMYLPSTFIYHNHKSIEKLPDDRGIRPFIHSYAAQIGSGQRTPKGYVLNQYTFGVALFELPFFLAAHSWEILTKGRANGFSESYRFAIDVSTFFYGCLGLWISFCVLRRRFSQNVAGVTTALLLIGTNLFWFVFHQTGMAHVPLFFLFALLLLFTEWIYSEGKAYQFALLGLTAGSFPGHILNDSGSEKKFYEMRQGEEFLPFSIKLKMRELMPNHTRLLCASGRFLTRLPEYDIYNNQLLVLQIRRGDATLHWNAVRINNKVGLLEKGNSYEPGLMVFRDNIWGTVRYFIPVPDDTQPNDEIQLDVWNLSKKPILIQDLCLGEYGNSVTR